MMTRRGTIGLLLAVGSSLLAGCDWIPSSDTIRYRVTAEVETPQGLRNGSSVIESTITTGKSWGDASGISYALHGEAVAVDIAPGQTVFALLRNVKNSDGAAYHAMLLSDALRHGAAATPGFSKNYAGSSGGPFWKEQRSEARRIKTTLALPPQDYPLLVRFRDIHDPKSVEAVAPGDLAASFGPGVRLRRITVAVTDDAVTSGIEKRLGWLVEIGKTRSTLIPNPPRLLKNASAVQLLEPSAFGTELYK